MAHMHPEHIISTEHVESEVTFYEACRDQLSDKCHVFYSLRWYSRDQDGVREDSECDFLIFNPDYGFLCVEVKGGFGVEIEGKKWRLLDHTGGRLLKRSPYEQAEQSMRFFKQYYEDETGSRFPGVYGCAAAFPKYNFEGGPENSSLITINKRDMPNLRRRVAEIFQYFQGRRQGGFLSAETRKRFLEIVNRKVACSIAAGALIEDRERELAAINGTQDAVIDLLTHYPRAFLVGGAGTGKTWIGLKKVRRCAADGGRALFLCYNRALADWARGHLPPEAACFNIDALAFSLLGEKAAGAPERDGCREYADLLDSLPDRPQYDLVVVDEGQDFTEDWALCANLLVRDGGSLYVFCDENQNLFRRSFGDRFCIDAPPFVLRYNIRNTAGICRFAQEQCGLGLDTVTNRLEGVKPECSRVTRKAQAAAVVDSIVSRLVGKGDVAPEKIVILSNRRRANSVLWDAEAVGGCPLCDGPGGEAGSVAYHTVQSFKGLESDVVIFLNHTYRNQARTEQIRATLYTAYTRAKFYLYVIDYYEEPDEA